MAVGWHEPAPLSSLDYGLDESSNMAIDGTESSGRSQRSSCWPGGASAVVKSRAACVPDAGQARAARRMHALYSSGDSAAGWPRQALGCGGQACIAHVAHESHVGLSGLVLRHCRGTADHLPCPRPKPCVGEAPDGQKAKGPMRIGNCGLASSCHGSGSGHLRRLPSWTPGAETGSPWSGGRQDVSRVTFTWSWGLFITKPLVLSNFTLSLTTHSQ
jgi:hypothetical protein